MDHELLQRAVTVREGLCRRAELHGDAEVVIAGLAVAAVLAVHAGLLQGATCGGRAVGKRRSAAGRLCEAKREDGTHDGDAVSDLERAGVVCRELNDLAAGLVAEDERALEDKGAVAAVRVVVD